MRRLYISAILATVSSLSLFAQKATWCDNIRVSGFAIAQYQWSNPKDNEANTFNLRMARVALDGRVAGDFYWKTQIQITGNTSTLASSPRLVDLFIVSSSIHLRYASTSLTEDDRVHYRG